MLRPMLTTRLAIIPVLSTHLPFLLLDHEQLGRLLKARIPDDWPPEFIDESTIAYVAEALADHDDSRWWMYLLVTRDDPTLVGTCGYKGPPSEGTVEIGYSVIPSRQRNGYATEAGHALTRQALKAPQVAAVRAETIASRPASIRVLEKCGYELISTRPEPELGEDVLMFECTEID